MVDRIKTKLYGPTIMTANTRRFGKEKLYDGLADVLRIAAVIVRVWLKFFTFFKSCFFRVLNRRGDTSRKLKRAARTGAKFYSDFGGAFDGRKSINARKLFVVILWHVSVK